MKLKYISIILLLLISCKISKESMTIYDLNLKKNKINLCDTNQYIILESRVNCNACMPKLIDLIPKDKRVVVVSITDKNRISTRLEYNKINNFLTSYNNRKFYIYFQFSRKNNPYKYTYSNKIFRKYLIKESPILLKSLSNCKTQIILPSNLK